MYFLYTTQLLLSTVLFSLCKPLYVLFCIMSMNPCFSMNLLGSRSLSGLGLRGRSLKYRLRPGILKWEIASPPQSVSGNVGRCILFCFLNCHWGNSTGMYGPKVAKGTAIYRAVFHNWLFHPKCQYQLHREISRTGSYIHGYKTANSS